MATHLVIGCDGQLGYELVEQLRTKDEEVIGVGHAACDITSDEAVRRIFDRVQPDVVYNAAAYNDVDQAESVRDIAMGVNGLAPGRIASACRDHGARLMHFSTDYVFGEGHSVPLDEGAAPDPMSVYARSKLLGEHLALRNNPQTFVMRVTGLYSDRRANFVKTMIRIGLTKKKLTVVDDQLLSPTWVKPVADVALDLVQRDTFGVYHGVCHGGVSWYDFARAIFAALDIEVDLGPVSQERWGAPARRPAYSVLDNCLLRLSGLDRFEGWEETLHAFLDLHGEQLVWEVS